MTTTPAPASARSRMIWWISATAPTSTPRVGSSKNYHFRRLRQCLRDDDFLLIAAGEVRRGLIGPDPPDRQPTLPVRRQMPHLVQWSHNPSTPEFRQPSESDILCDAQCIEETIELPILADISEPVRHSLGGRAIAHLTPVEPNPTTAEVALRMAHDDLGHFASSGADKPGYARYFAGEDRKGHVVDQVAHSNVFDAQDWRRGRASALGARREFPLFEILADHVVDEASAVEFLRGTSDHQASVAKNGDSIGVRERLLQR